MKAFETGSNTKPSVVRLIAIVSALLFVSPSSATLLAITFDLNLGFVPVRPTPSVRQPSQFLGAGKTFRFDLEKDGLVASDRKSGVAQWSRKGCSDAKLVGESVLVLSESGILERTSLSGKTVSKLSLPGLMDWLTIDSNGRYVLGASKNAGPDDSQVVYLFDLQSRSLVQTTLKTDTGHILEYEAKSFDNDNAVIRIGSGLFLFDGAIFRSVPYPHQGLHPGVLDFTTLWNGKPYALFRSYDKEPSITSLVECASGDVVFEYKGKASLGFVLNSPSENLYLWQEYRGSWRVIES